MNINEGKGFKRLFLALAAIFFIEKQIFCAPLVEGSTRNICVKLF